MVNLVKNNEGGPAARARAMQLRICGHLSIGQAYTIKEGTFFALRIGEVRIELETNTGSGLRPLGLQMLGWAHYGDFADHSARYQLCGNAQGKGSLARARRGHGKEVLWVSGEIALECLGLPCTQR